jgi:hypothetical protein
LGSQPKPKPASHAAAAKAKAAAHWTLAKYDLLSRIGGAYFQPPVEHQWKSDGAGDGGARRTDADDASDGGARRRGREPVTESEAKPSLFT